MSTVRLTAQESRLLAAIRQEVETLHALGYSERAIGMVVDLALRWGHVDLTPRTQVSPCA